MGEIIDSKIQQAENIVLQDLNSKKLGNQVKQSEDEPSAIHVVIQSATMQIDGKGNVK